MFSFPTQTRVHLAVDPVDMRKSFDGLWTEASRVLERDPFGGALFVFSNKKRNLVSMSDKTLATFRHCCMHTKYNARRSTDSED